VYSNPDYAFGGQSRMLRLIECIYDAAQDSTQWNVTLELIAEAIQGESIGLFAGFPNFHTPDLYAYANFPSGAWAAYSGYYAAINPIMERCESLFASDIPWASDLAVPNTALEKTEFYNDFFLPNDMHFSLGLRLEFDGLPAAALSCQRPKSSGAFSTQDKVAFQTLRPHLQRAFQLHHRISALEAKALGLETALDAHDHAVVGLDRRGIVCLSNPLALKMFAAGDGCAPILFRRPSGSPSRPTAAVNIPRPISRAFAELFRPTLMRDFIHSMKEDASSKQPAGPIPGASSTTSWPQPIHPRPPRPSAASANSMPLKSRYAVLRRRSGSQQDRPAPGRRWKTFGVGSN
jgi:hypothetical protein